ncbi:hypothetical protein ACFYWU_30625 [Streptomyces chrestomyceticus]|uniref:hypothetical protein n=1 Tax=Streptomyces chrestomyceticus TaxID=68185 RepID=UPI00368FFF30
MPAASPHPPGQPYVQLGGPSPYLGAEWEAQPNRSRRVLILCHVGMLIHFPVHVAMFLAVFAFILAFSLVGEFVFVVFFFLEKPAFRLLDRGLVSLPSGPSGGRRGGNCVTRASPASPGAVSRRC